MTIKLLGTCQAVSLARCLETMLPGVRVERYLTRNDPGAVFTADDVVFRQRSRFAVWRPDELEPNQFLYPRVWFNAFHPDLIYVAGPMGPVLPPLGDYHSSIVVYAWLRGLSADQTAKLFCEPVFEQLGFFGFAEPARRALLEEGRGIGFPLEAMLARWERRGRFMHTPNHPVLFVMADIARALLQRAGLAAAYDAPEEYLNDPMLEKAIWPVYPEIGSRLGVPGAYAFKPAQAAGSSTPPALLDLEEFIERSFEAYRHVPPSALAAPRLESPLYRDLERLVRRDAAREASRNGAPTPAPAAPRPARADSPYADLPSAQFWRRAVKRVPARDVDPVGTPPFAIDRRARIATAGSCFAQNMSRVLVRHGYNYFVAEAAPDGLTGEAARQAGYGVFSARCGNVYTARQLLQLFERAQGTFAPREEAWLRPDGRWADPFRPQIEPDGFATVDELHAERARHLAAVRTMFERLDVLIFTLGLTEAWRSSADGAVFPLAPGVVAGKLDPARHEFVNFTTAEVRDDLRAFLAALKRVNPAARVVLTVSPQPPIATYEPRHVLVSATYTKAALRAAADEVERLHPEVWYFPGYELVAGAFNRGAYYADDLRTVTPEGVDHVMRLFLAHSAPESAVLDDALLEDEARASMDVVCDEEAIALEPPRTGGDAGAVSLKEFERFLDREADPVKPIGDVRALREGAMEVLQPASMRAPVEAELPASMRARSVATVPCRVRNDGDVALVSAGKHAVFLCYRWYDEHGELTEIGESIHTPLPGPLEPGASASMTMPVAAPRYAGRYRLRVTLLQSEVAWFDDVDPRNGVAALVEVADAAVPTTA